MTAVVQPMPYDLLSPSLQQGSMGDGDSGFHELIDDAAAFELLTITVQQPTPPAQLQLEEIRDHHVLNASGSPASLSSATPDYSPVSPPHTRVVGGSSVNNNASGSLSSNASTTSTQQDGGTARPAAAEAGPGERSGEAASSTSFLSPSPAGSEEDVSGKESDDAFEDAGNSSPEEDELGEHWNPDFYTLQSQAPKPILVPYLREIEDKPHYYGLEYHGSLCREDAADLLGTTDGCYLVRDGPDADCILSFMSGGRMWNFRLFYEDNSHFVGEKHFEEISELVQDGLINLYLAQHNVMQAMEIGRNTTRQHSLRLKRKPCRRVKGPKGKSKSAYLEQYRRASIDSIATVPKSQQIRQMSSPSELETVPMTPNSNKQQSDLDLTMLNERRGNSTSLVPNATSTPNKPIVDRRAHSTESLQKSVTMGGKARYSPVLALRDVVRAERESLSQSVGVSILSEKAASILGIAPPKQFKRASMYDPLLEQKIVTESPPQLPTQRSNSYHPGIKRGGKALDKGISLPRDLHKHMMKKPPSSPSPYYKAHKFKPLTYVHPTWCVICHHFLWGLKMQGLRCQDCGIDIHRQCCAGSLDHECTPTKKTVKRMYGVDLTTLVKVEESKIPNLLQQCIKHIESTDLEEEGLYRVSGQTSEILELKEKFDNGEKIDLSPYADINVVTSAVKLYLRELPIPVVTFDAYNEIMKATSNISDPNDADVEWTPLANALKLLPKAHYNVFKYLVEHLHRVDMKSNCNKMTAYNLAAVFSPTLMRAPCEDLSLVKDLPLQRHFVELLILKHAILFA